MPNKSGPAAVIAQRRAFKKLEGTLGVGCVYFFRDWRDLARKSRGNADRVASGCSTLLYIHIVTEAASSVGETGSPIGAIVSCRPRRERGIIAGLW